MHMNLMNIVLPIRPRDVGDLGDPGLSAPMR